MDWTRAVDLFRGVNAFSDCLDRMVYPASRRTRPLVNAQPTPFPPEGGGAIHTCNICDSTITNCDSNIPSPFLFGFDWFADTGGCVSLIEPMHPETLGSPSKKEALRELAAIDRIRPPGSLQVRFPEDARAGAVSYREIRPAVTYNNNFLTQSPIVDFFRSWWRFFSRHISRHNRCSREVSQQCLFPEQCLNNSTVPESVDNDSITEPFFVFP